MMYMSFTGIEANANRGIEVLKSLVDEWHRMTDDERHEYENGIGNIKTCISAYRDTILGILKGDITVEKAKEFWFHFDPENIARTTYRGDILRIGSDEEGG